MDKTISRLNVFFENPFWVGVFEREMDGKLSVCKVTFGAEPKDYEVYNFILTRYNRLRFSPAVVAEKPVVHKNPKRMQREAEQQMRETGMGTKSQQALKLAREAGKKAHLQNSKAQKEAEKKRRFALRTDKKKQKHKGH